MLNIFFKKMGRGGCPGFHWAFPAIPHSCCGIIFWRGVYSIIIRPSSCFIVETGTTLKENQLEVLETIVPISARLISNKASYKIKNAQIEELLKGMREQLEERKNDKNI